MGMWREGRLGLMRASWGAPVLLWNPLSLGMVVLRVRCGRVMLGDWSNLWGETTSCSKARASMVGEVVEQQMWSISIGASGTKETSNVFPNHRRLGRWDSRRPVVEAGQRR